MQSELSKFKAERRHRLLGPRVTGLQINNLIPTPTPPRIFTIAGGGGGGGEIHYF